MNMLLRFALLIPGLATVAVSHAHHSFAAEFDRDKGAVIEGTVT